MDLALVEKALLGLFAAAVLAIAVAKLTGKRLRLPADLQPAPPWWATGCRSATT